MKSVDAGVTGLYWFVDVGSLNISAKFVFSQIQRDDLLESESVLHHHDATVILIISMLIKVFLLVSVGKF